MTELYGNNGVEDRWSGFEAQRTELLQHIERNAIVGVLAISGDFHFGGFFRVGRNASALGYHLFETLAGPGGSSINPIISEQLVSVPSRQLIETLDTWTYTRFTAHASNRTLNIDFVDDSGAFIYQQTLNMSTATPTRIGAPSLEDLLLDRLEAEAAPAAGAAGLTCYTAIVLAVVISILRM